MSKITERIAALVQMVKIEADGNDLRNTARSFARDLPDDVLRWIATEYLVEEIRHARRRETAQIERAATREAVTAEVVDAYGERGRAPRRGTKEREYWETCTLEGREWVESEREFVRETDRQLMNVINSFVGNLRDSWTQELLASSFALMDGTTVTWGEATIDDHRQRYDMFARNMRVNAEGAARHVEAIQALESRGAANLNQVVLSGAGAGC